MTATIALEIDQGDDEYIDIEAVQADGVTPEDISGCTLWFWIGDSHDDPPLIEKDTTDGVTITNGAGGIAEVAISNADTAALAAVYTGRKLRWELQVKDTALKITTLARGTIVINRDRIPATV